MDAVTWVRRHPVWSALCALAVILIVTVAVLWRAAGRSEPVSEGEALAAFRAAPNDGAFADGPRPGVYVFTASGSETGGAGPLAVTRDVSPEARLVVTRRPDGWESELSYSRQHIEGARYALRDGAVRITWRRTKVTFAGFGRDDRRSVEPPSLFVRSDVKVGDRWKETFRTGDLTVRADTRVVRTEAVDVDGRTVPTYVIASSSITEGPHPGTRRETLWWAPSLRLPVRWDVDMDIGGTFTFRTNTSVVLRSVVPAT